MPIFPAVVRYDELKRGVIDHALRVTVRRTKKEYVYPARHHARGATDRQESNVRGMGREDAWKKFRSSPSSRLRAVSSATARSFNSLAS